MINNVTNFHQSNSKAVYPNIYHAVSSNIENNKSGNNYSVNINDTVSFNGL